MSIYVLSVNQSLNVTNNNVEVHIVMQGTTKYLVIHWSMRVCLTQA